MFPAEFLKIKEKQKAFGMNNGLRVHEVALFKYSNIFSCFILFLSVRYFLMIFSVQKVSTDKAVMAFTQGMLVSSQLVLR